MRKQSEKGWLICLRPHSWQVTQEEGNWIKTSNSKSGASPLQQGACLSLGGPLPGCTLHSLRWPGHPRWSPLCLPSGQKAKAMACFTSSFPFTHTPWGKHLHLPCCLLFSLLPSHLRSPFFLSYFRRSWVMGACRQVETPHPSDLCSLRSSLAHTHWKLSWENTGSLSESSRD